MKYFVLLILLIGINVDPQRVSFFPQLDETPKFTSGIREEQQWSSETREYCFFGKELSYFLQYEFSPVPTL